MPPIAPFTMLPATPFTMLPVSGTYLPLSNKSVKCPIAIHTRYNTTIRPATFRQKIGNDSGNVPATIRSCGNHGTGTQTQPKPVPQGHSAHRQPFRQRSGKKSATSPATRRPCYTHGNWSPTQPNPASQAHSTHPATRPSPISRQARQKTGNNSGNAPATIPKHRHSLHCPMPRPMVYSFCLTLVNTKGPLDEKERANVGMFRHCT